MKKPEFIEKIAAKTGMSKKAVDDVLKAMIETVWDEIASSGESILHGFGKFKTVDRAARSGRNPRTGEAIEIAAHKGLKFKITKGFGGDF